MEPNRLVMMLEASAIGAAAMTITAMHKPVEFENDPEGAEVYVTGDLGESLHLLGVAWMLRSMHELEAWEIENQQVCDEIAYRCAMSFDIMIPASYDNEAEFETPPTDVYCWAIEAIELAQKQGHWGIRTTSEDISE